MKAARPPLKTFGRARPKPVQSPIIKREVPCTLDENESLQVKIDQVMSMESQPKRSKASNETLADLQQLQDNEEEDEEEKPSAMKSLHELMEEGENSRFFDEIEYLVEGLRTGTTKSRVLSMEELLGKVFGRCAKFGSRMRAHGMLTKTIGYLEPLVMEGNGKAVAGAALLVVGLCHDVRQLSAFIPHTLLIKLSSTLLITLEDAFAYKWIAVTPVFKEVDPSKHTNGSVALWLLAKLVQTTKSTDFEFDTSILWNYLQTILSTNSMGDFEFIRIRWCLLVIERFGKDSFLDHTNDLLTILEVCFPTNTKEHSATQSSLAMLSTCKALVEVTGPDTNSQTLARNSDFIIRFAHLFQDILENHDLYLEESLVCLISAMVNLVDRNGHLKDDLRYIEGFLQSSANIFQSLSQKCSFRDHLGLLLAFLMEQNGTNAQLISKEAAPHHLAECVQRMLDRYQASGSLSQDINQVLATLLTSIRSYK